MKLQIREFQREDNEIYKTWFSDPDMDRFMGPAWSEEELVQILQKDGTILSILRANRLVAVVSFAYPYQGENGYTILGISVDPQFQRQGIGDGILKALQLHLNTPSGQKWVAFVGNDNAKAHQLMQKHGWCRGEKEDGMFKFTYIQPCA